MNSSDILKTSNILKAGILLSIVAACIAVSRSSLIISHPQFISAVTIDLTLTLPLAYLFFIRKTRVSKLTVVPLFVFGVIAASLILPAENRRLLDLIKFFALPAVEFAGLTYVGFVVYKSRKTFQTLGASRTDFLENLRETLVKEFPVSAAANAAAYELAGFYYALIRWKTRRGANLFTYHKRSGVFAVLPVLIFLTAIETVVLHVILAEWSAPFAWILTALSAYFLFQLVAHGKAIFLRPTEIADGKILVRCGLVGDAAIDIANVESVELTTGNFEPENGVVKLSPLGKLTAHNLKINLRGEAVLNGIYGIRKTFKTIFITVDEAEKFKKTIEDNL